MLNLQVANVYKTKWQIPMKINEYNLYQLIQKNFRENFRKIGYINFVRLKENKPSFENAKIICLCIKMFGLK